MGRPKKANIEKGVIESTLPKPSEREMNSINDKIKELTEKLKLSNERESNLQIKFDALQGKYDELDRRYRKAIKSDG